MQTSLLSLVLLLFSCAWISALLTLSLAGAGFLQLPSPERRSISQVTFDLWEHNLVWELQRRINYQAKQDGVFPFMVPLNHDASLGKSQMIHSLATASAISTGLPLFHLYVFGGSGRAVAWCQRLCYFWCLMPLSLSPISPASLGGNWWVCTDAERFRPTK